MRLNDANELKSNGEESYEEGFIKEDKAKGNRGSSYSPSSSSEGSSSSSEVVIKKKKKRSSVKKRKVKDVSPTSRQSTIPQKQRSPERTRRQDKTKKSKSKIVAPYSSLSTPSGDSSDSSDPEIKKKAKSRKNSPLSKKMLDHPTSTRSKSTDKERIKSKGSIYKEPREKDQRMIEKRMGEKLMQVKELTRDDESIDTTGFSDSCDSDYTRRNKRNRLLKFYRRQTHRGTGELYIEDQVFPECQLEGNYNFIPFDFNVISSDDDSDDSIPLDPGLETDFVIGQILEAIKEINPSEEMDIKKGRDLLMMPLIDFSYAQAANKHYSKLVSIIQSLHQWDKFRPVQGIAHTAIMQGLSFIGISKTGSGKTMAFMLPAIVHTCELINVWGPKRKDTRYTANPITLIFAPTRELTRQLYDELCPLAFKMGIAAACLIGGENQQRLKLNADIVVCTMGKLLDAVKHQKVSLVYVTLLVLDEADEMLNSETSNVVMDIVKYMRPDRQVVLFSATWVAGDHFEKLMNQLFRPDLGLIHIEIGEMNKGTPIESQIWHFVEKLYDGEKHNYLVDFMMGKLHGSFIRKSNTPFRMGKGMRGPFENKRTFVFFNSANEMEDVFDSLPDALQRNIAMTSGRYDNVVREESLNLLKEGKRQYLFATENVARGVHVEGAGCVINYDICRDIKSYNHRSGRCGRKGHDGFVLNLWYDWEVRAYGKMYWDFYEGDVSMKGSKERSFLKPPMILRDLSQRLG